MASAQARQSRREQAFYLFDRGTTIHKVKLRLGISFSTAARLRAEWKRSKSRTSIAPRPYPGATNLLW